MPLATLMDTAINSIKKGRYLAHGNDGIIYVINPEVVLKVHNGGYHGTPQKSAQHEFALGTELYQQRVQVPQYLELFTARLPTMDYFGVFMQRIKGVEPSSLSLSSLTEAQRQYAEQKKLIDQLGYKMSADSKTVYSNALFDQKKRKLFLYDLVQWKRK